MKKFNFKILFSFCLMIIVCFSCLGFVGCSNKNDDDLKVDFENNKILITYFSATGSTKNVANLIKENLESDILEITPTSPYSSADLNYNNSNSRVSLEHNAFTSKDTNSAYYRPSFSLSAENFDDYNVIFIGYPIWWGEAPNIIYSFLEKYSKNLSGKTIIPFCTSASSSIGQSATHLKELVSDANWSSGKRFSSNASSSNVKTWIDSLTINKGE